MTLTKAERNSKTKILEQFGISTEHALRINEDKLHELTTENAVKCYNEGYFEVHDFISFHPYKIAALTDSRCLKSFEKGYFTPNSLSKLNFQKIRCLTSDNAISCYKEGYFKPTDLLNKDATSIWHLTNDIALQRYNKGEIESKSLLSESNENIAKKLGFSTSHELEEAVMFKDYPKEEHNNSEIELLGILHELPECDLE